MSTDKHTDTQTQYISSESGPHYSEMIIQSIVEHLMVKDLNINRKLTKRGHLSNSFPQKKSDTTTQNRAYSTQNISIFLLASTKNESIASWQFSPILTTIKPQGPQ